MRLTPFSKIFLAVVILGTLAFVFTQRFGGLSKLAPPAVRVGSNVPPKVELPDQPLPSAVDEAAGCSNLPEVRFYHWAWNAQMGLMLATGGKQATEGSLMCKQGVNLKLIREDVSDTMASLLVTFAERLKKGEKNPAEGAHFIGIMGDGSAAFLKGVNDKLAKLGPDYTAMVVGSAGYSRGEDKFMGPPAWKQNPQAARGGVVAGYLRDGDWNIALKWLGDNRIPNNPDETTYDPDALNWVNATDYIDAAQKYVSGYCAETKHVKTGAMEKHCVDGVVTWTPGDVTVAEKKGGLVSIVSTREYRSQMPHVIIGSKKWMAENRPLVLGMLAALFEAADQVKRDDDALRKAAGISALVYGEKDAEYWYKYFRVQNQRDAKGLMVELGGSAVSNLEDNLQLFGLQPGSTNLFAATYTLFGNIVKSQYPEVLPSFDPVAMILDPSFVVELSKKAGPKGASADLPSFHKEEKLQKLVSRRSWEIQFATGSAKFSPTSTQTLEQLFAELVIAGGTLVEIHGHTDGQGGPDANQKLSEERAFAMKEWLESRSATNFPDGRVRVFAHGMSQPIAPNTNEEGRAKNRRVEIVLGTSDF